MKRGRLLKRKSRKQSLRSLIWKSILSEDIEWTAQDHCLSPEELETEGSGG